MLNVDTHVLLCAVVGTLRPRETRLLRAQPWSISAIVLWEIAKLAQLGRIGAKRNELGHRFAALRDHYPLRIHAIEQCQALLLEL